MKEQKSTPESTQAAPDSATELTTTTGVVGVEGETSKAEEIGSASICGGSNIPLTAEESEQLRANLAAATAELQAEEHGPMDLVASGSSWVVVEQKHVQPVADASAAPGSSDKLREWV